MEDPGVDSIEEAWQNKMKLLQGELLSCLSLEDNGDRIEEEK